MFLTSTDCQRPPPEPRLSSESELCSVPPPPALFVLPAVACPHPPLTCHLQLPSLCPMLHRALSAGPTYDHTCRGGDCKGAGAEGPQSCRSGGATLLSVSTDFLLFLCLPAPPQPTHLQFSGDRRSWRCLRGSRLVGQAKSGAVSGESSNFLLFLLSAGDWQSGKNDQHWFRAQ